MPVYDADQIEEQGESPTRKPGVYECEVADAVEKIKEKGSIVSIHFKKVGSGESVGWDNLFFYEKSKALGIAHQKVKILGLELEKDDEGKIRFFAEDLKFKRALIEWEFEVKDGEKTEKFRPKFKNPGFGYQPLEEKKDIPF